METTLLHKNEGVFLAHEKQRPKGQQFVPWASFPLPHLLERYYFALALLRRVGRLRDVGRCYRFHEAADFLRRAPLHIVGDVRIGVQCEPCAEVAQHTGQGFHIHAAGDCHRCECVPLRYNYDKPEKPRISRVVGLWQGFSSFSKPKNRAAK